MIETYSPDWTALELIDARRRRGESMRQAMLYAKADHCRRLAEKAFVTSVAEQLIRVHGDNIDTACFYRTDDWVDKLADEGLVAAYEWRALREREIHRPFRLADALLSPFDDKKTSAG